MRRAQYPGLRGRGLIFPPDRSVPDRLGAAVEVKRYETALVWFRRDLRHDDHAAFYHALKDARQVHCVFVFDTEILDRLVDRGDRRVEFIWLSVKELARALEAMGGGLQVLVGRAREMIPALADKLGVQAVYANHDYEPIAVQRDAEVSRSLDECGRAMHTCKDHVIFEKDEILTQAGRPYTVFTPYKRAWLAKLTPFCCKAYPVNAYRGALAPTGPFRLPSLEQIGFQPTDLTHMKLPTGMSGARSMFRDFLERIDAYRDRRDYPGVRGVSYLSVHLRFGTLSIRELVRAAVSVQSRGGDTWLSELVWRDFYFGILHHFPQVAAHAFRPEFEALRFSEFRRRDSPHGVRAARGIPWSMRRCDNSIQRATCTIACAWLQRRSWSRTCTWIGAGAKPTSPASSTISILLPTTGDGSGWLPPDATPSPGFASSTR